MCSLQGWKSDLTDLLTYKLALLSPPAVSFKYCRSLHFMSQSINIFFFFHFYIIDYRALWKLHSCLFCTGDSKLQREWESRVRCQSSMACPRPLSPETRSNQAIKNTCVVDCRCVGPTVSWDWVQWMCSHWDCLIHLSPLWSTSLHHSWCSYIQISFFLATIMMSV